LYPVEIVFWPLADEKSFIMTPKGRKARWCRARGRIVSGRRARASRALLTLTLAIYNVKCEIGKKYGVRDLRARGRRARVRRVRARRARGRITRGRIKKGRSARGAKLGCRERGAA
jgi:hypothetical protein